MLQARIFLAATALFLAATPAMVLNRPAIAAAADYRLEALDPRLPAGKDVTVAVRLIHAPSGKPVANAVLVRSRLDMSPEGMGDMTGPLMPVESKDPGVWRFKTRLPMVGDWALSIQAKVPGETDTVQGTVVITGVGGQSHGR